MSKKSLLKENTIRRFMKLASIGPLTENFVDKIKEEDEELEEGGYGMPGDRDEMAPEEEVPGEELGGEEMDMAPEEELPMDMAPEEGEGDLGLSPEQKEELGEKLADTLTAAIEDALGAPGLFSVEREDEVGEEPAMEPELEEPMEEPMEEPVDDLEESEETEELEESTDEESNPSLSEDDDLVNDITRRVTERLLTKNEEIKKQESEVKKEKYLENLAEQITNRIFSSSKKNK